MTCYKKKILVICPVSQITSYRLNEEARGLAFETNPKMTNIFQAQERPFMRKVSMYGENMKHTI